MAREREELCASWPQGTRDSELSSSCLSWWGPPTSAEGRTGRERWLCSCPFCARWLSGRWPNARKRKSTSRAAEGQHPASGKPAHVPGHQDRCRELRPDHRPPHPNHSLSSLPGSQRLCQGDTWTSTDTGRREEAEGRHLDAQQGPPCRGARSVNPAGSSTDPRLAENTSAAYGHVNLNGHLLSRNKTPVMREGPLQSDIRQMRYKAGPEQKKTNLGYKWRHALCLRCQTRQEMGSVHAAEGRAWGWASPAPNSPAPPVCEARLPEERGDR